jgi:hypothetical protein
MLFGDAKKSVSEVIALPFAAIRGDNTSDSGWS